MHETLRALSARRRVWPAWAAALLVGLFAPGAGVAAEGVGEFSVRSWSSESGWTAGEIYALARTRDGFLWLGTDAGLVRFDGVRFEAVELAQLPLPSGEGVSCLLVDQRGGLWAGTTRGRLWRRGGGGQFQELGPGSLAKGVALTSLAEDGEGGLWASTARQGIFCRRQGQWQTCGVPVNALPGAFTDQVLADERGRIWGVLGGQLQVWQPHEGRFVELAVPSSRPITWLAAGHEGDLWVATCAEEIVRGGRMFQFKAEHWSEPLEPYAWPQDSWRSRPHQILADDSGRLWVATAGGGVFYARAGQPWRSFPVESPLSHDKVNVLMEDQEGTLWVALQGGQLFEVRPRLVTTLRPEGLTPNNEINAVCVRREGSVWAATYGEGVFCYRAGHWKQYGPEQGLASLYVFTLYEDRQTNLWAGTREGLFRLEGNGFKRALFLPDTNAFVSAMLEDRQGALWISTAEALLRRRGQTLTRFATEQGLEYGPETPAIAEDPEGRIWAAFPERGFFRQAGERFEHYVVDGLPPGAAPRDLRFDAEGVLWVSTAESGLLQIKGRHVRQWTLRDGLPSNYLMAMVLDKAGTLWLGTGNGIIGLHRQSLEEYVPGRSPPLLGRHLSVAEGLDSQVCSGTDQFAAARSADGRLWFPNQRVVAVFDPASTEDSRRPWTVTVEKVQVDGVSLPLDSGVVRVRSGARRIEFHYTLPELRTPGRVRFRYRLQGLEEEWGDAGQERVVNYNRLPPGDYEFRVMASTPEGIWRESAFPLKLEVVPRPWERTSVRVAGASSAAGALAAIVWVVSRSRIRRRHRRQIERLELLRAAEQERARIARDLHDDLGSDLTRIVMLSDMEPGSPAGAPAAGGVLAEINQTGREMTAKMSEIVWALNPKHDSLDSFAGYVAKRAYELLAPARIDCRLDLPLDLPASPLRSPVRHNVLLAFKEALHNIVKHAQATNALVALKLEGESFVLTVQDNGKGFAVPGDGWLRGHGLANMKHRLAKVGGRCEVRSQPGGGACVRFTVPLQASPPPVPPVI